jgi:PGF-pre-PGF domain-containing protein
VNVKNPPTPSSGSGGGGAGISDEPENVEETVFLRLYLGAGSSSTYNFNNVITSVEVTPEKTYGLVAAMIEVLFGQPGSITTDLPAGVLFKYVNIFVGTSGWSEGKLSSSVINFQVPASWCEENNIDHATVIMYRYHDDGWQSLETTMTGQTGGYYQYSSSTPGFSTFMILGQVDDPGVREPVATPDSGTVTDPTPTPETTSDKGMPGFGILLGIMGVLIAVYLRKR